MESILASGTDQLIPELSPEVYQNQASYVVSRTQTSNTCPTPVISPGGVRTAKLNIVDGNFLDLRSLHFSFRLRNSSAPDAGGGAPATALPLQPLSAIPHSWWRRLTLKCNGAAVEDINFVSRVEEQISRFVSTNKRRNWGDAGHGWATLTDAGGDAVSSTIAHGASQRVTWRPLSSGFLQMTPYLPMLGGAAGGLEISLECADAAAACRADANFTTSWQIEDLQVHVDSVQLTSEMTNNFAQILTDNDSIKLTFQANACDVMYLNGTANQVLSLAKQYSRLSTVMVSLAVAEDATAMKKEMNHFYLPASASAEGTEVESYIQVNNQRWPQQNIKGPKEHFMRMMSGLGVLNSASHSVNIGAAAYASDMFVALYDLETIPHAEGTGVPVQGGGQVQIFLKNVGAPLRAYVTTHYDACLEIKNQGAIVFL